MQLFDLTENFFEEHLEKVRTTLAELPEEQFDILHENNFKKLDNETVERAASIQRLGIRTDAFSYFSL
ncbi:hypothetical protein GCK32_011217 [Trichostrongylus colubriformis]|uniref:Uncharacterized protein n=1 Tax=Trichostrongylus colubriformis TaxID=6319 RepID=A0AAN8G5R7_TRICO